MTRDDILDASDCITSTEAARLSGLSLARIAIATKTGDLPSVKAGSWRLIPRAAFEAWLKTRKKKK